MAESLQAAWAEFERTHSPEEVAEVLEASKATGLEFIEVWRLPDRLRERGAAVVHFVKLVIPCQE